MLEKKIEHAVCEYAKSKSILCYKFTSPAKLAVPDRLFIRSDGYIWFCEFKSNGKLPTAAQYREHTRLRNNNVVVYVIDNIEAGKKMIDDMSLPL